MLLVEGASQPAPLPSAGLDAPLDSCLAGLPQGALLSMCDTAAALHMPLTLWLTAERLRHDALAVESLAWRDLASGMCQPALQCSQSLPHKLMQ